MAEAITHYLYQLMDLADVTVSRQFLSLLNDHDGAGGAESSGLVPENAVDFLLQPCSTTSLYVARRAKHEEEVEVPAGSTVLWRFQVGDDLDIQFNATFRPHPAAVAAAEGWEDASSSSTAATVSPVVPPTEVLMEGRFPSPETAPTAATAPPSPTKTQQQQQQQGFVQGSYTAPATSQGGTCTFTWDNAYSRLRGKQLQYVLQVVTDDIMQAAMEAAEELSRASSRNRSLIKARIQAGEGGKKDGKGRVVVKVTPVARPAVDADAFFNKADDFEEQRERIVAGGRGGLGLLLSTSSLSDLDQALHSAGEDGDSERAASGDRGSWEGSAGEGNGRVRRSSLGVIWDYLYSNKEDAKGEEPGGTAGGGGGGRVQQPSNAELERVVGMIEKLEDELAHMTAKKEQAEAEAVIALAKQRRWSIEKEKFERKMHEAVAKGEQLAEQIKTLQGEKAGLEADVAAKQEEVETALEAAKRADRERDVLKAEKHVWTVAHSGVQAELTNLSGTLEKEKQAHEDTRTALKKAKEAAHRAKAEAEGLRTRLEVKVDERTLQTAQEELSSARAEIRDLSEALEETAAENDTLRGQMKLLAKHVKQQKQDMAVVQTELGHVRMRASTQEKAVAQLKAEKKLLVKEIKAARVVAMNSPPPTMPPRSGSTTSSVASSSMSVDGLEDSTTSETGTASTGAPAEELAVPTAAPSPPRAEEEEVTKEAVAEAAEGEQAKAKAEEEEEKDDAATPLPPISIPPSVAPPPEAQPPSSPSSFSSFSAPSPSPSPPPPKKAESPTPFPILSPAHSHPKVNLESDERYQRLLSQLRNVTERRKQLLLLSEEDPQNQNVRQLLSDLETVVETLQGKMRTMLEAAGASGR